MAITTIIRTRAPPTAITDLIGSPAASSSAPDLGITVTTAIIRTATGAASMVAVTTVGDMATTAAAGMDMDSIAAIVAATSTAAVTSTEERGFTEAAGSTVAAAFMAAVSMVEGAATGADVTKNQELKWAGDLSCRAFSFFLTSAIESV